MTQIPAHLPGLIALSVLTALGYAGATVGMKLAGGGTFWLAVGLMGLGFTALAEILLMRRFDVAMIYVVIISMEALLIFAFALWIGETLTRAQVAGTLLVLAGLAFWAF